MKIHGRDVPELKPQWFSDRKRKLFFGLSILGASAVLAMPSWLGLLTGCRGEIRFGSTCGNDTAEGDEVCDGTDLRGQDCVSRGFESGTLLCNNTCDGFNVSGCEGTGPICGNDVAEGDEVCDGTDLRGQDCVSRGFESGTLLCNNTCDGFNVSGCEGTGPVCGNDVAEGDEVCDGADLRGEDCVSQGFSSGALACNSTCDGFDTSGCTAAVCGNNVAEGDEVCDGTDLRGENCVSRGFEGGTLLCNAACDGFDTSGCTAIVCGDNVAESDEVCDGTDLQGQDCVSQGFSSGTLACNSTCDGFDVSGCVSACESGPGKDIVDLLNEYRMDNGLDPIPCSPSLMTVSETHVWDLYHNQPHAPAECNLHSWSDQGSWTACCYTSDHAQAACMWNKPSELTLYTGYGYENSAAGASSPAGALNMWKNSSGHNAVMLNEGVWANLTWRAVGAALYQNYAVLWFGEQTDPDG